MKTNRESSPERLRYSEILVDHYNHELTALHTQLKQIQHAIGRNEEERFSYKNTLLGRLTLPFFGGSTGIARRFKELKLQERTLERKINHFTTNRDYFEYY